VVCYDLEMNEHNVQKFFDVRDEVDMAIEDMRKRKFIVDKDAMLEKLAKAAAEKKKKKK
jgi:hypothetical protein